MKREKNLLYFCIIIMFCSHIPFDNSGIRLDIYPFYDYSEINPLGRPLTNILWESGMYFISWIFIFFSWLKDRDKLDFYFLIWWSYNIITYFLFFQQGANMIGLPLILILLLYENRKSIKNIVRSRYFRGSRNDSS